MPRGRPVRPPQGQSMPHEKTFVGVTSMMTASDSLSAAWSGYCGYFE